MFDLVKALTELPGMVGQEEPVQKSIRQLWTPHSQEVVTTGIGNVVAHVGGRGSGVDRPLGFRRERAIG